MRIVGGIDYSMTSPALTIHFGDSWDVNNCKFFYITSKKKYAKTFMNGRATGFMMPDFDNDIQRFSLLADIFLGVLKEHDCNEIGMEGYSMGSRNGRIFNIGENGGILKHNLYKQNIAMSIYPPTVIKNFATKNGKANKQMMVDAFLVETGIDMVAEFGLKSVTNPVDDIVDSYYMTKYRFFEKTS